MYYVAAHTYITEIRQLYNNGIVGRIELTW